MSEVEAPVTSQAAELGSAVLTRRAALRQAARLSLAGTALGPLAGLAAGCGSGGSSSGGSGGPMTGDITLMTFPQWIGPNEVKDFERLHPGVTVHQINGQANGSTGEVTLIVQNPDQYDIALADLDIAQRIQAAGLLAPYNPADTPNIKYVAPAFRKAFPYGVPTDTGAVSICYRKDIVTEPLTSWADLWRLAPKYSGRIVLEDSDRDIMAMALKSLGYSINTTSEHELAAARDALTKLKPHVQAFLVTSPSKPLIGANPSAVIAVTYSFDAALSMNADNRIAFVAPSEGMPAYLEGWVPLKQSGHRKLSLAFMDFHMQPRNYASFVKLTGTSSLQPAALKYLPSFQRTSPALNFPPAVTAKLEFERFTSPQASATLTKYYEQVKSS